MKLKLLTFLILFVCSSQSTFADGLFLHYDHFAQKINPTDRFFIGRIKKEPENVDLVISADLDSDLSSEYFGAINFVFANNTDKWIIIKNLNIESFRPKQNQYLSILTGPKYHIWKRADEMKRAHEAKQTAFIGALVGAAIASQSNSDDSKLFGAGLSLKSLNTLSKPGKGFKHKSKDFPANHLLKGDIIIPPGMFQKKWIIFNSTENEKIKFVDILKLTFNLNGKDGQERFLQFRTWSIATWQASIPAKQRQRVPFN